MLLVAAADYGAIRDFAQGGQATLVSQASQAQPASYHGLSCC